MSLRRRLGIRNLGDRALGPSVLTLQVLKDAAEAINIPILKGSVGILLTILRAIEKAKANVEACKMLAERAGRIVLAVNRQICGVAITSQFRTNIVQFEDILKDIQEFVYKQEHVHLFSWVLHGMTMEELVAKHDKRLDDAVQLFQIETLVTLRSRTELDGSILRRIEVAVADIQDVLDKTGPSVQEFEGIPILRWEEVNLDEEICRGRGYRIHTASYQNKVVIAKVFEGTRATRDWVHNAKLSHSIRHPNILQLIAISSPSTEPSGILFNGGIQSGHKNIESLIALALRTELTRSVNLGIRLIHGIATGLDYLCSRSILPSSIGLENFDILIGEDDKVRISFNIVSTQDHAPNDSYSPLTRSSDDEDWVIFNDLCRKTLETANYLLYKECIKREAFSGLPPLASTASPMDSTQESLGTMPEQLHSEISPRREFVWMDRSRGDTSLEDVSRRFGEYAEVFSSSPTNLRRIVAPKPLEGHDCPGYLREEITLTTSIGDSAIVYHTTPTQHEVCVVCGSIVSRRSSPTTISNPSDPTPSHSTLVPRRIRRKKQKAREGSPFSEAPVQSTEEHSSMWDAYPSISAPNTKDPRSIYICQDCGVRFDRPSALKTHMRSHTGEKPYICRFEWCQKAFSTESNMLRHERTHSAGSAFEPADDDPPPRNSLRKPLLQ